MIKHLQEYYNFLSNQALVFLCSIIAYSLLARLWPHIANQKILRKGFFTDLAYWFFQPLILSSLYLKLALVILFSIFKNNANAVTDFINGNSLMAQQPIWLQLVLYLLISDLIMYWIHRFFHGNDAWKYHAIHHSPTEIDWLSSARFHPVNFVISFTSTAAFMMCLGFHPICMAYLGPINIVMNGIVHANLNWTFGPLKYVIASPVFHRWHHALEREGRDKNFAPTFPFIDVIFGTFYMPKGKLPTQFGIDDDMPENYFKQLLYPFKKISASENS